MGALVLYESMFGNTHEVAEAIARGLGPTMEVAVLPVSTASEAEVLAADLLVVGAPTHVHGVPRPTSRQGAADQAAAEDADLALDEHAAGPGVREWVAGLDRLPVPFAAFDTRIDMNPLVTGRASKWLSRHLRRLHASEVAEPTSFLVDKQSVLEPGESDRAVAWGEELGRAVAARDGGVAARHGR